MRRLCSRLIVGLVFFTITPVLATAKSVKIHGYVTNIVSPTEFEIEDYKISSNLSLVLDFDKGDSDDPIDFRPEDVRIGTELEIKGEYDESTGELKAKSIKVFLEEHKKVKRTALIERVPEITSSAEGWAGEFFADGQRIRVESTTKVLFKPNQSERKALEEREKVERKLKGQTVKPKAADTTEDDPYLRPLESLDQIGPNTFMAYEGVRQSDGSINATRVEFMRNEHEKSEADLWKKATVKVKPPEYLQFKPGEINVPQLGKFKLVASQEVQSYISNLGSSLIPAYQRALPADDPNKIPFVFYVVDHKVLNAFALPNGTIVIHSQMLEVLENEAQLAAVLGHEIGHATQEHVLFQQRYHGKKLLAMSIGAAFLSAYGYGDIGNLVNMIVAGIRNGYSRSLENQADRVGLEYMIAAGYDPREAPRVWKVFTQADGDGPTDFFWSTHDNHTTRRSYLMAELRNNYADRDIDSLKRDDARFAEIVKLLKSTREKKGTVKVKY